MTVLETATSSQPIFYITNRVAFFIISFSNGFSLYILQDDPAFKAAQDLHDESLIAILQVELCYFTTQIDLFYFHLNQSRSKQKEYIDISFKLHFKTTCINE